MLQFTKAIAGSAFVSFLWLGAGPVQALTNGGFESGLSGWSRFGDGATVGFIGGQSAVGNLMAVITTAASIRDDDALPNLNISGHSPLFPGPLETGLGVDVDGGLDPDTQGGITASEGSGISQSFQVTAGDKLSFRWNMISNDLGSTRTAVGGVDAAYFIVTEGTKNNVALLALSGLLANPAGGDYVASSGNRTFQYTFKNSGQASIGFAVVDALDFFASSALLIDQVILTPVPEVPLWAMMVAGVGIVASRKVYRR